MKSHIVKNNGINLISVDNISTNSEIRFSIATRKSYKPRNYRIMYAL